MKKVEKAFHVLYPNAAGIDIASKAHFVSVRPDADAQPTRSFGTFTEDLYAIADWLEKCKADTVAMEATGIYWVSLFLVLEERGFEVILVNAKHVKNVRGKKTDVKDAEWIRQLHSCGLLSPSFQPDSFSRSLRAYMRHRKNMQDMSTQHIHMMQKAFEQMNIKLQNVITDITGKSGQAIIKAIIEGERNAETLAQLVDWRVKASQEEIKKSLIGLWKPEHLLELSQSYEMYQHYREKMDECDKEIEKLLKAHPAANNTHMPTQDKNKPKPKNKNNVSFDAAPILQNITGTDLEQIYGITGSNALEILSEIGFNINKWPTVKHFTSWLNLAPNNKISGGKILSSKIGKKKNKAGQIFRLAAYAIKRSNNYLANFFKRIQGRKDTKKAVTATARKIAVIFYNMMKNKTRFNPLTIEDYAEKLKAYQLQKLKKQAHRMGAVLLMPEVVS